MNTCELCGDLFPQCECQSVVANCSTCGTPIFGREDYARGIHWSTKADTYTCELCVQERREEQQKQDEWRNTWSAA
jgi:hypothetical protein